MKIILDCNIWISFLIGHHTELMQRILSDYRFDITICAELLEEIHSVCSRAKVHTRVNDEELEDFFHIIYAYCSFEEIRRKTEYTIRDPKDMYLLSLADQIGADYIVTGDADLLDLNQLGITKMMTLAEFKTLL